MLVFSKIQLLLCLFPPQMVEIKQISIIPCGKEMDGFCSFQAIHHFWEGEQDHLSNDTLDLLLRTPTNKASGSMFEDHYYLERNQRNRLPSLFFHKHVT